MLALAERLEGPMAAGFDRAVMMMTNTVKSRGRVIVTGMGKSGLIAQKIAATLNSTGTPAQFLHPAEALHGDLGMLAKGDVVIALSYSGETEEILKLLATLKRLGDGLISFCGRADSTLARASDVFMDCGVSEEACALNLAPTASTTVMLALGDALAIETSSRRGFKREDFADLHPGGKLGKRLAKVRSLMHAGDALPHVNAATPMKDVIYEMSRKKLGMTTVVEGGKLLGIVSDGDLRRLLEQEGPHALEKVAGDVMNKTPKTIAVDAFATSALAMMEELKITSLVAVDEQMQVQGVVHLHDLWGTELI